MKDLFNSTSLEELNRLILFNPNIPHELKPKVIECVRMIVNKYPAAYRNLYINLKDIKIEYANEENKKLLESINASSLYDAANNLIILEKSVVNSIFYKNLLIHELIQLASHDKENETIGFESLNSKYGVSLNEGMAEYLTGEILNNHKYGMAVYANDINNVLFFNRLLGKEEMINAFFYEGLQKVLILYINKIGSSQNIENILTHMDLDHKERLKGNFNSEYKDEYIKYLVEDLSKLECESEIEVNSNIRYVCGFICGQYKSKTVPESIKLSIENSINTILSKYMNRINKQI